MSSYLYNDLDTVVSSRSVRPEIISSLYQLVCLLSFRRFGMLLARWLTDIGNMVLILWAISAAILADIEMATTDITGTALNVIHLTRTDSD